jgi:CheY-like chemotaxis protein
VTLSVSAGEQPADVNETQQSSDLEWLTSWLIGKRVLLVEDDLLLQKTTERVLTNRLNASVDLATDGEKGLNAYNAGGLDLVITDYLMPNLDGAAMIQAIRSAGGEIPIVALTAATIGEERNQLISSGADVVMDKPIDLDAMANELRKQLGSEDLVRESRADA